MVDLTERDTTNDEPKYKASWSDRRVKMHGPCAFLHTHLAPRDTHLSPRLHLVAGSRCAQGSYRMTNEDKCYADTNHRIFLTADGMGGHYGGETASGLVVNIIPERLQRAAMLDETNEERMQVAIEEAIHDTHKAMMRFARRNPMYSHMGSTMALAVVYDDVAYVTSIGDCRVYHLRNGKLRQLTKDQTFVQAFVDAHVMTPEEAHQSSRRNIVTNFIGVRDLDEEPVVQAVELKAGDRLLLTTDGVTDVLPAKDIERLVASGSPQDAADNLVLESLRQGSHDNAACVVIKVAPAQLYS